MTDEQEPGTEPAAIGDDETTRTPVTPPSPATPAPAVPPMTPAWDPVSADPTGTAAWTPSPRRTAHTGRPHRRARIRSTRTMSPGPSRLRSSRVAPPPAVAAAVACAGRPPWRSSILILGTTAAVAAIITGRSAGSTVLGYVPANTIDVRGGPARPARRPAPGRRRVPPEVPGLQRPGRARHQARRGPRRPGPRGDRQRADLHRRHQAVVRRRARLQHGPAAARGGPQGSGASRSATSAPWPWSRSRTRPARRRGSTPSSRRRARPRPPRPTRATRSDLFQESRGIQPAYAIIDGKVIAIGDEASVKAAIDTNGSGGFADEPGPKAALGSVSGDHVGFAYTALRPLLAWSEQLSESMGAGAGASRSAGDHRGHAQGHP